MWALKAFLLGAFAFGVLGYAAAAALAVAAQAGGARSMLRSGRFARLGRARGAPG